MTDNSVSNADLIGKNLPDNIFASVVRSLYADPRTLLVGIICMAVAPMVMFWKGADNVQLIFSACFLVFGLSRLFLTQAFDGITNADTNRKEYKVWENRYLVLSSLYVALMGAWVVYCYWYSADAFGKLISLSLALSYMSGIIGRNFGSDKIVNAQVLIGSALIVVALTGAGGLYNMLLAAFLLPYFIAIRIMSARLRKMLHSAEIVAHSNKIIASRFDTALENITHGIAMFSKEGEITVANERFLTLTNMEDTELVGKNISVLGYSKILTSNGQPLLTRLQKHLNSNGACKFTFTLPDDCIVEVDFNAISEGGVAVLTDITEQITSERAIRDLANYDVLTRMPNRRFFVSEVERRLLKNGALSPCSMFFIDLDKFKEVNDTLGHAIGDRLLKAISARLVSVVKHTDLMCRFGGDEFVVVVPDITDEQPCSVIAERVISELSQPVQIDHHSISIGASVGIAVAPLDGETTEELLQHTDAALYESKSKGRGLYTFYSSELGGEIKQKRELEIDLKSAIKDGTLQLHFQPLINLKQGKITTCEALARWTHPVYGAISPERFVRIAEESGSIGDLGKYVLKQAMLECLRWGNDVRVAVNVSAIQFHRSDVYGTIARLLRETRLDPARLEIEITETVMLSSFHDTISTLSRLSELGVKISLDDFGTGFSSLSYLHQLPLDKVKIDRSFIKNGVTDMKSNTLLKGVVNLTKALGLTVVLEGIETDEQMSTISSQMEIDEVQGYLFSRPLPAKDIRQLLGRFITRQSAEELAVARH